MQNKYQTVIELIREGDVVLFVGSGFSIKAGAPSGRALCDLLYNSLPDGIKEERSVNLEYTLQNLSNVYEKLRGRDALIGILKNAFDFDKKDETDQRKLSNIPLFKTIITTNYDSLIEDAFSGNCNLVVTSSDLSKLKPNKPTIYKIHGDFSHPDNIVITKKDYNRLYAQKQESLIWNSIITEFSRHTILFIGYSLSDQNIQILLEYIKEQLGDSTKRLFVLLPDVEESALLQFKDLGVEYIKGTAGDLFNELIPYLKDHIVEDFEQKKATAEDFSQFLKEYDLQPSFELGDLGAPNKLLNIRSVSGKEIHQTLNFSFKRVGEGNPLDNIETIFDKRFGNLPVKRITDFHGFELRANDILINRGENVTAIYLYRTPLVGEMCISIPKKQIIQKVKCRYYDNGCDQLQIDADVDIGVFQIMIPIATNDKCGFSLKHKNKYTNNTTAINWATIFYSLFCGLEFSITIISEKNESRLFTYSFKKSKLKQERKEAKLILQYYKYVQDVELLGYCFNEYQNYSDENFEAIRMIYHYLKKEPIIVRHSSKGYEYHVQIDNTPSPLNTTKEFSSIQSFSDVTCQINGKCFKIPYVYFFYKKSVLKSIKKDSNGRCVLRFVDKAKEHTVQLTDSPIQINSEEGEIDL